MSWNRREILLLGAGATAALLVGRPAASTGALRARFLDEIDTVRLEAGGITPYDLTTLRTWITPTESFFVRNHFGVPYVKDWSLAVAGRVAKMKPWSLDGIRSMPHREAVVTLECAGNSIAQRNGLLSTARFAGARIADFLERVEAVSEDDEIVFTGADKPFEHGEPYARSMRVRDALATEALLAWEMNGEPLPKAHGAPLRLVVPGWYGMASVKWLTQIELRKEPFAGRYQRDGYVNAVRQPDGSVKKVPVTRLRLKSIVASAASEGETVRLRGAVWGGDAALERVEVTFDGGKHWEKAVLEDDSAPAAWRLWHADWKPPGPGRYVVASRAFAAGDEAQPLTRPKELEYAPYERNEVIGRPLELTQETR